MSQNYTVTNNCDGLVCVWGRSRGRVAAAVQCSERMLLLWIMVLTNTSSVQPPPVPLPPMPPPPVPPQLPAAAAAASTAAGIAAAAAPPLPPVPLPRRARNAASAEP